MAARPAYFTLPNQSGRPMTSPRALLHVGALCPCAASSRNVNAQRPALFSSLSFRASTVGSNETTGFSRCRAPSNAIASRVTSETVPPTAARLTRHVQATIACVSVRAWAWFKPHLVSACACASRRHRCCHRRRHSCYLNGVFVERCTEAPRFFASSILEQR